MSTPEAHLWYPAEGTTLCQPQKMCFLQWQDLFRRVYCLYRGIFSRPRECLVIVEWLESTTLRKLWSFHRFAIFYRRFISGFSMIVALITDCIKNGDFEWTTTVSRTFQEIKKKLTEAPVLRLSDLYKPFEICDASRVGIGHVLSQEGHPIAFFSEKLNES